MVVRISPYLAWLSGNIGIFEPVSIVIVSDAKSGLGASLARGLGGTWSQSADRMT